jgi:hypothetical protein
MLQGGARHRPTLAAEHRGDRLRARGPGRRGLDPGGRRLGHGTAGSKGVDSRSEGDQREARDEPPGGQRTHFPTIARAPSLSGRALQPALRLLGKQPADLARARDVGNLEVPRNYRPVPEQAAERALLDLDRAHPLEPHSGSAPLSKPIRDEELFVGENDVGAVPAPDGDERDHGAGRQQKRADGSYAPARLRSKENESCADARESEGRSQRAGERRTMWSRLQAHVLAGIEVIAHESGFGNSGAPPALGGLAVYPATIWARREPE